MTELELIVDLHKHSDRQGPGSEKDTLKALELITLPAGAKLKIADLGCGTGGQTLTLARALNAQITAVDLFDDFLDELHKKAQRSGLDDKIIPLKASMDALPFNTGELDLIWSEGAIYNIGFENGLKLWKNYLKPGGYLAVSEVTWITPSRPEEVESYWQAAYPQIDTASNKIKQIEDNGYTLSGYFYLSPESWINTYYQPLQNGFETFLKRNNHSALAQKVVDEHSAEIEFYQKFSDHYSYGFYIARKN